MAHFINSIE